jgi:hypothetical protein
MTARFEGTEAREADKYSFTLLKIGVERDCRNCVVITGLSITTSRHSGIACNGDVSCAGLDAASTLAMPVINSLGVPTKSKASLGTSGLVWLAAEAYAKCSSGAEDELRRTWKGLSIAARGLGIGRQLSMLLPMFDTSEPKASVVV